MVQSISEVNMNKDTGIERCWRICDLELSRRLKLVNSSRAISHVSCLYKTDVSTTISGPIMRDLLCRQSPRFLVYIPPQAPGASLTYQMPDDGDRHGCRNVGFIQTPDATDGPRGIHWSWRIFL